MAKETVLDRLKRAAGGRVPDADLTLLADVVRHVAVVANVPLKAAAADVLEALADDAIDLFGFRPGDWPIRLSACGLDARIPSELQTQPGRRMLSYGIYSFGLPLPAVCQAESVKSLPPGLPGWFALLHMLWVSATPLKPGDGHLGFDAGGYVAITREDAARLFGFGAATLTVVAIQSPLADAGIGTDSTVVQPVGGKWPHKVRSAWVEAERDAMRSMRDAGMSDIEIAKCVGCLRQTVGSQIGSKAAKKRAGLMSTIVSALSRG